MDKVLRNVTIFGCAIIIIALIAVIIALSGGNDQAPNTDIYADSQTTYIGDAQQVSLSVRGGTYVLSPSTLQKDVPVRMTVDMNSVKGCARSIVIPDFGVRKYVSPGDNIIEFTPTKTGTIRIACSMNMYIGEFKVE